jgi:hypothetical protein
LGKLKANWTGLVVPLLLAVLVEPLVEVLKHISAFCFEANKDSVLRDVGHSV